MASRMTSVLEKRTKFQDVLVEDKGSILLLLARLNDHRVLFSIDFDDVHMQHHACIGFNVVGFQHIFANWWRTIFEFDCCMIWASNHEKTSCWQELDQRWITPASPDTRSQGCSIRMHKRRERYFEFVGRFQLITTHMCIIVVTLGEHFHRFTPCTIENHIDAFLNGSFSQLDVSCETFQ